jgi:NADPH:quinone reductase-like Zn-dependent oxidoreductase
MRSVAHTGYGRFELREVDRPEPGRDEVLLRVIASSLNAADWYGFAGRPYFARLMTGLRRPKSPELGHDFAGAVEAVGAGVERVAPGDEVFGYSPGAYAEYVVASSDRVVLKPANLSFDEAAALPLAGTTALQGLRDHGALKAGERVLVNGASGGVGTAAVQIAKALGAEVDAVCSARNVEQARALGAARVFDYTREDFSRSDGRYDLLFDNAGNRSWRAMRRVLAPSGRIVLVGGRRSAILGPLGHVARIKLATKLARRNAAFFIAKSRREDLETLRDLVEAGKLTVVIQERYDLHQLADAMQAMDGHARAKIVLRVAQQ